jgi:hypothetical protein
LALRKFYNPETGVAESNSPQKEKAVNEFYDAVWESEPFKALSAFLRAKKHPWAISPNMLKSNVKQIWFDLYSRAKGRLDSSAFEHVFFGEVQFDKLKNSLFESRSRTESLVECTIGRLCMIWKRIRRLRNSSIMDFTINTLTFFLVS